MSGLREALDAAFESASDEGGGADAGPADGHDVAEPVQEVAPVDSAEASAPAEDAGPTGDAGRARDERGRFAAAKQEAAEKAVAASKPTPVTEKVAPLAAKTAAPAAEPIRAPQSWKPGAREKWANLPPEAQQEVLRREKEVAQVLQESAPARKFHEEFQRTIAPYEMLMRAQNIDPLRAVDSFFRTEAALRTGTPEGRAQVMAQLIKSYGVDIGALDAALSGQAPQQGHQGPAQYRDPRLDAFFGQLEQAKSSRQRSEAQRVVGELQTFGGNKEFFEDLRNDMADLIEVAARQGRTMSLEDAYSKASQMHPEISQVLRQREEAKKAANAQASTQRARVAASSVKSQPAGAVSAPKGGSLREALEAAFESSGR